MQLYILRGLPNSGKTTLANILAPYSNWSADQWFELQGKLEGKTYNEVFNKEQVGAAQVWCWNQVEEAMLNRMPRIAVHNTFVRRTEVNRYLKLAFMFEYTAHVITVERAHSGDNKHNVPDTTRYEMLKHWQPMESITNTKEPNE